MTNSRIGHRMPAPLDRRAESGKKLLTLGNGAGLVDSPASLVVEHVRHLVEGLVLAPLLGPDELELVVHELDLVLEPGLRDTDTRSVDRLGVSMSLVGGEDQ